MVPLKYRCLHWSRLQRRRPNCWQRSTRRRCQYLLIDKASGDCRNINYQAVFEQRPQTISFKLLYELSDPLPWIIRTTAMSLAVRGTSALGATTNRPSTTEYHTVSLTSPSYSQTCKRAIYVRHGMGHLFWLYMASVVKFTIISCRSRIQNQSQRTLTLCFYVL